MLSILGKSKDGDNVLHIIVGPESSFFVDIIGRCEIDVTDQLQKMDPSKKVILQFTRSDSEMSTMTKAMSNKLSTKSSFIQLMEESCNGDCEHCTMSGVPGHKPRANTAPEDSVGKCNYCKQEKELLDIPHDRICKTCAAIELGLKKERKNARPDARPVSKPNRDANAAGGSK